MADHFAGKRDEKTKGTAILFPYVLHTNSSSSWGLCLFCRCLDVSPTETSTLESCWLSSCHSVLNSACTEVAVLRNYNDKLVSLANDKISSNRLINILGFLTYCHFHFKTWCHL